MVINLFATYLSHYSVILYNYNGIKSSWIFTSSIFFPNRENNINVKKMLLLYNIEHICWIFCSKPTKGLFVIWRGLSMWSNWYTHIKMVLFSSLIWSNYTVCLLWKFMVLITLISLQLLAELTIFIFPISNMYGISPGFW